MLHDPLLIRLYFLNPSPSLFHSVVTLCKMALTTQTLRSARVSVARFLGLRWAHSAPLLAPLDGIMGRSTASPALVLPEFDRASPEDSHNTGNTGFGFPSFSSGGSMELMAVPKKKVSRHKKKIRNAAKALKPIPVIIRCKSCGQVKLPHFYCCSGDRGNTGEQDASTR